MTTTIVGLLGAHSDHDTHPVSFSKVLRLLDPSGEDERLYLLAEGHPTRTGDKKENCHATAPGGSAPAILYELVHVLSDDDEYEWSGDGTDGGFTSMFVGNFVVNRPLHTFTPVDPLFWVLAKFDPLLLPSSSSSKQQNEQQQSIRWQPLHQIVAELNLALPETIVEDLLRLRTAPGSGRRRFRPVDHLFKRMNMGGFSDEDDDDCNDDEVFYKFCPERALAWLCRKQRAVETVMTSIAVENKKKQQSAGEEDGSIKGTAFESGFCFGGEEDDNNKMDVENRNTGGANANEATGTDGDPSKPDVNAMSAPPSDSILDSSAMQRVKDESVQVVCQYLPNSWREALLMSMELSRLNLEGKSASPASNTSSKAGAVTTVNKSGLPTPHQSIEEQLLGVGVGESNNKLPAPTNKKPKIKPSDTRGMKKMTSFFTKK